jgi:hypothetical protein
MQQQSPQGIANLSAALRKAQARIGPVLKKETAEVPTKGGGKYEYRYANLAAIIEVVRDPLNDNGLAYWQAVEPGKPLEVVTVGDRAALYGTVAVTTYLSHDSGEWIAGTVELPYKFTAAPDYGSAVAYARRYGLRALIGVADEDQDPDQEPAEGPAGTLAEHPAELEYLWAKARELFGDKAADRVYAFAARRANIPDGDIGKIPARLLPLAIKQMTEKAATEREVKP